MQPEGTEATTPPRPTTGTEEAQEDSAPRLLTFFYFHKNPIPQKCWGLTPQTAETLSRPTGAGPCRFLKGSKGGLGELSQDFTLSVRLRACCKHLGIRSKDTGGVLGAGAPAFLLSQTDCSPEERLTAPYSPVDLENRTIYKEMQSSQKSTFLHLPEVEDSTSHLCCFICSSNPTKEAFERVL